MISSLYIKFEKYFKMKKIILFSFVAALSLVSCKKNDGNATNEEVVITEVATDTVVPVDGSNAQSALDWAGTYIAQLPCANCPGIITEVVLNADNTFTVTSEYIDTPNNRLIESGTITWYDNGNAIELKGDASAQKYKVIENGLIQLDASGNEITSDMKELYVFKKKAE